MVNVDAGIEGAKLELEREKLTLEDKWKKRTYIWTIVSALLTAGVALAIAFLPGKDDAKRSVSLSVGPIENCLSSLKRTSSLSAFMRQAQETSQNLMVVSLIKEALEKAGLQEGDMITEDIVPFLSKYVGRRLTVGLLRKPLPLKESE